MKPDGWQNMYPWDGSRIKSKTGGTTVKISSEPIENFDISQLTAIKQAICEGGKLHVFRSGGGLRVTSMKDYNNNSIGYGEHPYFEQSLLILEEDIVAGCRSYEDTYGPIHTHYMTGAYSNIDSVFDRFILNGNTIDIECRGPDFWLIASFYSQYKIPNHIQEAVIKFQTTVRWQENSITYEAEPIVFPGNGELGTSCRVLENLTENDPFFHKNKYEVKGNSLKESLEAAKPLLTFYLKSKLG